MSTHTSSEPNAMPFRKGQTVRHKSGMLGVVTRCERRVCQGTTRVCLTVEYHPGSKLCDWYADNCELVEDVKAEPTGVESELTSATPLALPHPVCRGCSKPLDKENLWMADGCPCNSERGVNHGLVPVNVCTCKECDPAQTGSHRAAAHPKPTLTIPNVGTLTLGKSETYVGTFDLEPGTLGDQGEFLGVSEINGAAVHAEQTTAELKAEIESLAAQRDEARDELKEATAEFVRALAIARRELVLERAGHAGAKAALKKAIEVANGWSKRIEAAQFVLDGKTAEVQS